MRYALGHGWEPLGERMTPENLIENNYQRGNFSRLDPCSVEFGPETPKFRFENCRGFLGGFFLRFGARKKARKKSTKKSTAKFTREFGQKIPLGYLQKPSLDNSKIAPQNCFLNYLVGVSDIFYFFCSGEGKGVRGARKGCGGPVSTEKPRRGGVHPGERERAGGRGAMRVSAGNFFGGELNIFISGPKFPPRLIGSYLGYNGISKRYFAMGGYLALGRKNPRGYANVSSLQHSPEKALMIRLRYTGDSKIFTYTKLLSAELS